MTTATYPQLSLVRTVFVAVLLAAAVMAVAFAVQQSPLPADTVPVPAVSALAGCIESSTHRALDAGVGVRRVDAGQVVACLERAGWVVVARGEGER
jgi:hypothetical protein